MRVLGAKDSKDVFQYVVGTLPPFFVLGVLVPLKAFLTQSPRQHTYAHTHTP